MKDGTPVVTIVVTGADGSQPDHRVARSVSSARGQSMRSVEVLVTEANIGIARATGEYLMFLAAGNELDVHAARACVAAAMDTGAELVAGRWEVARGQQDPAVLETFRHTIHVTSIDERPELRGDQALSNKLFATDLLRRARLSLADDDVAGFTAQAYAAANGIALIPQRLYVDHLASAAPSADDACVATVDVRGSQLVVQGSVTASASGRAGDADTTYALVVAPAGTDLEVAVPATVVDRTPEVLHWECTLDLRSVVRPTWRGYRNWGMRLAATTDGQRTLHRLWVGDVAAVDRVTLLRHSRWLPAGNVLHTHVNARGNLTLRLVAEGVVGRQVARVSQPAFSLAQRRPVRRAVGRARHAGTRLLAGPEAKARVYRRVLTRLPLQRQLVVFESHMGQALSDNPRYIFEELHRRDAGFDIVWSFAGKPPPLPSGVRAVRRNSWGYFLALARAKYWVDNQGFPGAITKPTRTTYLQTWHGSALKHMGEDTPAFRRMSAQRQARHREMVARWDYFVTRTEHDVRALVPALHVQAEILRTGYPRNDPLVQMQSPEQRTAVRAELGLPADGVLVLYAPTFRETYEGGRQPFELRVDLDKMLEKLPDHLLLVRTHYLQRLRRSVTAHPAARDVSSVPDIAPLLVAADILVTDYSSVMFDFANTGRPMVFFTYDYDDYANSERGVYFELQDKAPGPMVRTGDELIQALATADAWRADFDERYRAFVAEFGEYDTGTAARQVVDHVFFGPARGK